QQELDAVVGIAAFIHVLGGLFHIDVGVHLLEFALGEIAAAHVLIDEDIAGLFELIGGAEVFLVLVFSVGGHAVRRAVHQERIGLRRVFGNIDGGEEFLPVAHGDAVLELGVVRPDVVFLFLRRRALGR